MACQPLSALVAALLVVRTAAIGILAPTTDNLRGAGLGEDAAAPSRLADPVEFDSVLRRHASFAQKLSTNKTSSLHTGERPKLSLDVHLLVSLYLPEDTLNITGEVPAHVKEMLAAFSVNLENPLLTTIHVLLEAPGRSCQALPPAVENAINRSLDDEDMTSVYCVAVNKQPTYADFFRYANTSIPRGGTVLLANADIVFDGTLSYLQPLQPGREGHLISVRMPHYAGEFRSIYRKPCAEVLDKCTRVTKSWDAYAFSLPLPAGLDHYDLQFTMNMLTADHRAAFALNQSGMRLTNPCMHINAFHWHCFSPKMHSDFRDENMGARLSGIYMHSYPCRDFPSDRCALEKA